MPLACDRLRGNTLGISGKVYAVLFGYGKSKLTLEASVTDTGPEWPRHILEAGLEGAEPDDLAVRLSTSLRLEPLLLEGLLNLYRPLAAWLAARAVGPEPLVVGVNGAQGTGKSTAAQLLKALLEESFGLGVCEFSIDDLYLSRAHRQALASEVHPLLATRGVPGTHNLPLALEVMQALKTAGSASLTPIPRFNKAIDDCVPTTEWESVKGRPRVIILEGWCVGARAQRAEDLVQPCNNLEKTEDPQGIWRQYVNRQLGEYQPLFAMLDLLIMLKAPSFTQVYEWRLLQEEKLRESLTAEQLSRARVMNAEDVARFIAHYERLTRWMLTEMPGRADMVFDLDEHHRIHTIHCHV